MQCPGGCSYSQTQVHHHLPFIWLIMGGFTWTKCFVHYPAPAFIAASLFCSKFQVTLNTTLLQLFVQVAQTITKVLWDVILYLTAPTAQYRQVDNLDARWLKGHLKTSRIIPISQAVTSSVALLFVPTEVEWSPGCIGLKTAHYYLLGLSQDNLDYLWYLSSPSRSLSPSQGQTINGRLLQTHWVP